MKRFSFLFIVLCFAGIQLFAQAPQSFKYQAVVRNADGEPYANKNIAMRIGIVQGSVSGQAVYTETHQVASTDLGLVNLEIGKGTPVTGTFSAINWGAGTYFVKVEFDPNAGSSFTLLGTSQLLSVPYSLYAEKAGNGFSGNYNDLTNKPDLSQFVTAEQLPPPFSGNYNDLTNKPDLSKFLTADDVTQGGVPKLQVSRQGDTLSLGKDNFVIIPGLSANTYDPRRMTLQKIEVVDVKRNSEANVEVTISFEVKSAKQPYVEYYANLSTDAYKFESQWNEYAYAVPTGNGLWQGVQTYTFENTQYIPAGTGQFVNMYIFNDYDNGLSIAPIDIAIPTGEMTKSKPVITDVRIQQSYSPFGLYVETEDYFPLQYVSYTQTAPGKTPENKQGHLIYDSFFWVGNNNDIPLGTEFSNIRVTDILGQESDAWDGTVTYNEQNSHCEILVFKVTGVAYTIYGTDIVHIYPWTGPDTWEGYPTWPVAPEIMVSPKATISPDPSVPQNFVENPVTYVITAEDGTTMKAYTVRAEREVPQW